MLRPIPTLRDPAVLHAPGRAAWLPWHLRSRHGHDWHLYPLVVPLHDPERYWPAAQLVLEQVAHCLLAAKEQARVWYLPFPHVAQVEQAVLEVPEHPPLLYLPEAQVRHVEHLVLEVPEHPPLLYLKESPVSNL